MDNIHDIRHSVSGHFSDREGGSYSVSDEALIGEIERLFLFYEPWSTTYPNNFRAFTIVKRMVDVSISGGFFLSHEEKKKMFFALQELQDGLFSGYIKHIEIPKAIEGMLSSITENNSKARLVTQTTKIESLIHAQLKNEISVDPIEPTKQLMERIISKITPSLPEMNAMAAAKELHLFWEKIVNHPSEIKKAFPSLEGSLKQWLNIMDGGQ